MKKRPNIVLIVTDQLRADTLGIENHPVIQTPNIDSLATLGTRFEHAYSTCPSCIAARRSLLTGIHPQSHGLVGFRTHLEYDAPATLPGELKKAGYQTYLVGRPMHQYPRRKRYGYDHMVFHHDEIPGAEECSTHGLSGNGWTARPWHTDEKLHPTRRTVDEALKFLRTWRDPSCPFFLTVSFIAPHPPLAPPAFYMERYLRQKLPEPFIGDWAEKPEEGDKGFRVDSPRVNLTGEALHSCRAAYYGEINYIDDQIQRLLQNLVVSSLDGKWDMENTIFVFTTDHGEMLGDHYCLRKGRGYEAAARIPMIFTFPQSMGIGKGQVHDTPVCLEDIMPTILDVLDLEIPPSVEGKSLVPLLRDGEKVDREFLHGEHAALEQADQGNHYLTDGKIKYIWFSNKGNEQLFDLDNDPNECTDLSADAAHAETLALWRGRLVDRLKDRPEGFSDGKKLIAGLPYEAVIPGTNTKTCEA